MKILFVCSGNAYRSPVAEALLRKLNSTIEVDSAGTDPAIPISEVAKEYLSMENALKYLKRAPEGLDEKELDDYDIIVAMEPEHREAIISRCINCREKVIVWHIDDPYFLPHGHARIIFEQIKSKINELAKSL